MKDNLLLLIGFIFFTVSPVHSQDLDPVNPKTMAVLIEGTGIPLPFAGGTLGGGLRYEFALFPVVSLVFPIEYRYVATSGFSESSKFEIVTAGAGGKFYFSQLFWQQQSLQGFFFEGRAAVGYAHEKADAPNERNNTGVTFALTGALGYSHAFDFGFVIGGSVGMTARGFTPPIQQPLIYAHPIPEFNLSLGWAF